MIERGTGPQSQPAWVHVHCGERTPGSLGHTPSARDHRAKKASPTPSAKEQRAIILCYGILYIDITAHSSP